jgi:hypothetical protein
VGSPGGTAGRRPCTMIHREMCGGLPTAEWPVTVAARSCQGTARLTSQHADEMEPASTGYASQTQGGHRRREHQGLLVSASVLPTSSRGKSQCLRWNLAVSVPPRRMVNPIASQGLLVSASVLPTSSHGKSQSLGWDHALSLGASEPHGKSHCLRGTLTVSLSASDKLSRQIPEPQMESCCLSASAGLLLSASVPPSLMVNLTASEGLLL